MMSHRELVENLILRDIKSRYKQSILGYAWAIFNPLVLALIYTLVGSVFMRQQAVGLAFAIHSYFGLLFWNLFSTGLATATEGLVSHLSLITKVYFPREVFPISAVLSKVVDFAFGLVGIIPLLLFYKTVPSVSGLLLILPVLVIQLIFTMGLGLLLSCANLFYRDVRYLVQLTLSFWIYLVPNIYTLDRIKAHSTLFPVYLLNPMAVFIEVSRRLVFPQTGPIEPLLPYLALATVVSLVLFVVGFAVFKRYEPRFAESI
jgi:ABC-type polysaccharide/polyol phosphate export permease